MLSGLFGCCPHVAARRNGGENVSPESYIECVFENDLVDLNAAETLAVAEANEHTLITAKPAASTSPRTGPTCIPATLLPKAGCPAANEPPS